MNYTKFRIKHAIPLILCKPDRFVSRGTGKASLSLVGKVGFRTAPRLR